MSDFRFHAVPNDQTDLDFYVAVKVQRPMRITWQLNASISVYHSDYGDLKLLMNRFQREHDLWLLNPDYMGVRTLEPMQTVDLARTGLTNKKQIWTNYTLQVSNEAAHGVLADLNVAVL